MDPTCWAFRIKQIYYTLLRFKHGCYNIINGQYILSPSERNGLYLFPGILIFHKESGEDTE